MNEKAQAPEVDLDSLGEIVKKYEGQRWSLIPLLQEVQEQFGYIPPEGIKLIADGVGMFPSQVQGVISFYAQIYTTPRGRNVVRVCQGTACHVRGGKTILKLVKEHLNVEEGQTTPDLEYTLETVACVGVCALAPNVVINNNTYGEMNPKRVPQILARKNKD